MGDLKLGSLACLSITPVLVRVLALITGNLRSVVGKKARIIGLLLLLQLPVLCVLSACSPPRSEKGTQTQASDSSLSTEAAPTVAVPVPTTTPTEPTATTQPTEEPDSCPISMGTRLAGADLRGLDLRGCALSGQDLSAADLRGANLSGVDLRNARLDGADLSGADLSEARFTGENTDRIEITGSLESWTPDGSKFVTYASDIIEANTGTVLSSLPSCRDGFAGAWSPDGSTIASACDQTIALWDAATGEQVGAFGDSVEWTVLAWSPDGSILAAGTDDGTVVLWDVATGEALRTISSNQSEKGNRITELIWSADGTTIAGQLAWSKLMILWNVQTGAELLSLDTEGSVWSLGQDYFVTADSQVVTVRSAKTGALLHTLTPKHDSYIVYLIADLALSPDETKLAVLLTESASTLNEVDIWDTATGKVLGTMRGPLEVEDVIWSPDGKSVILNTGDALEVWDAKTYNPLEILGDSKWIKYVMWSPDGSVITGYYGLGSAKQRLVIWIVRVKAVPLSANLSGANLEQAGLPGADLRGAIVEGADFSQAYLDRANLAGQDLRGIHFDHANLSAADLSGVDLSNASLEGAKLSGAKLSRTILLGTNLSEADLMSVTLTGANLTGADAHGAILTRADLSGANLTGVNFSGATFEGAKLISADLTNANFQDTVMLFSDLSNTILHGSDFTGSGSLESANLTGAKIAGVKPVEPFVGPVICNGQRVPEMPVYDASMEGTHPIVIHLSPGSLITPEGWQPTRDNLPELVACVASQEITVEVCRYTYPGGKAAPSITRKRIDLEVIVRSANSGLVLASRLFQGRQPGDCPFQTSSQETEIRGGDPESSPIVEWLTAFVETP